MRDWLRGISLAVTAFCLGCTSGMPGLGIVFGLAFAVVTVLNKFVRTDAQKRPAYRKWLAYGGIVPCAIWWVVTPAVDYGVSPYLVYIPGWYLLYLAFLQWRSLHHGGFEVFVLFDGVAALLAAAYQAPRGVVLVLLIALVLWVVSFVRRGVSAYKFVLFLLLFAMLSGSSVLGFRYWKEHRYSYGGKVAREYYLKNRMMGFDPVASLGSFRSNYESRYNREVVLRVWDTLAPRYIKAAAYEKYVAGIWKLPSGGSKKLYPSRYQVDYAVFEVEDSFATVGKLDSGLSRVWVQSTLDNFGFFFAANGAVGVAVKNDDSLNYFYSGVFTGTEKHHSDWYYFVNHDAPLVLPDSLLEEGSYRDLLISEKYEGFLDSVIAEMNLEVDSLQVGTSLIERIENYFVLNFKYALVVPGVHSRMGNVKEDPLRLFWRSRQGYCEYYATLATLILRRMGVRARYVTGFYGGERLAGRPYVVFRRHHAHAWVEAFVDGRWVSFDPTPPTMMFAGMEPSYLDRKMESVRGKWARFIHLLKDGEWRKAVDSWQNVTSRFVNSPYLYVLLGGLLLAVCFRRGVRVRAKKEWRESQAHALHVARWSKVLDRAERKLAHKGFVRKRGETVGAFILRIEDFAELKELKPILDSLKEYENRRWQ